MGYIISHTNSQVSLILLFLFMLSRAKGQVSRSVQQHVTFSSRPSAWSHQELAASETRSQLLSTRVSLRIDRADVGRRRRSKCGQGHPVNQSPNQSRPSGPIIRSGQSKWYIVGIVQDFRAFGSGQSSSRSRYGLVQGQS